MSGSYAASDATLDQNPGLKDSAVQEGTTALDRAEDREVGLSSQPGITNEAATTAHQGLDQATGENTPSTRAKVTGGTGATIPENRGAGATEDKSAGEQVSETVSNAFDYVTKNLK